MSPTSQKLLHIEKLVLHFKTRVLPLYRSVQVVSAACQGQGQHRGHDASRGARTRS